MERLSSKFLIVITRCGGHEEGFFSATGLLRGSSLWVVRIFKDVYDIL